MRREETIQRGRNLFTVAPHVKDNERWGRSSLHLGRRDRIRLIGILIWSLVHPYIRIAFDHNGSSELGRWVDTLPDT